jgi:hypothetical protein
MFPEINQIARNLVALGVYFWILLPLKIASIRHNCQLNISPFETKQ